jgi:hypothetical protein
MSVMSVRVASHLPGRGSRTMEAAAGNPWKRLAARAMAELAVVVLGVSIALWADSRVSLHDRRAVESARLEALSVNVDDTLGDLRSYADETREVVAALRDVLTFRDRPGPRDTMLRTIRDGFLGVPDFQPQLGVYDDLKSSGELALLTNAQLRQSLSAMDARLRQIAASQADVVVVQQLNLDRYLVQRLNLELLLGGQDDAARVPGSASTAFVSDREFRNLVLLKLDVIAGLSDAIANAEPELIAVKESIATQLSASVEAVRGRTARDRSR